MCKSYLGDTHTNATHYDMSETERPRHPLLTTMWLLWSWNHPLQQGGGTGPMCIPLASPGLLMWRLWDEMCPYYSKALTLGSAEQHRLLAAFQRQRPHCESSFCQQQLTLGEKRHSPTGSTCVSWGHQFDRLCMCVCVSVLCCVCVCACVCV